MNEIKSAPTMPMMRFPNLMPQYHLYSGAFGGASSHFRSALGTGVGLPHPTYHHYPYSSVHTDVKSEALPSSGGSSPPGSSGSGSSPPSQASPNGKPDHYFYYELYFIQSQY